METIFDHNPTVEELAVVAPEIPKEQYLKDAQYIGINEHLYILFKLRKDIEKIKAYGNLLGEERRAEVDHGMLRLDGL